jgi:hypothetical protein
MNPLVQILVFCSQLWDLSANQDFCAKRMDRCYHHDETIRVPGKTPADILNECLLREWSRKY